MQLEKLLCTPGAYSIEDALGPIDADFYFGDVLVKYDYRNRIKGVLAQWESVTVPKGVNAKTFLQNQNINIPVILFYGANDDVINPNTNFAPASSDPVKQSYNSETTCIKGNIPFFKQTIQQITILILNHLVRKLF